MLLASVVLAVLTTPSPSPEVSPTPSPPNDPCGSILSVVNRPTIGTGVCTVRTGHFDLESGYTNTVTAGASGGYTATYPQALLRVGTSNPHLDVELGVPAYNRSDFDGTETSGWSDVAVGSKYELGYSSNADWGTNVLVTIPTGSLAFTGGHAQFTANFNWAYTVNAEFGISGTVGFNDFSGYDAANALHSYFAVLPTLELSAALPGGPSQVSAEYAYFSQAGPQLGGKSVADFIYQRDFGPHVQLDVEYGFSPTAVNGQRQRYLGAGLSFMN